MNWRWISKRGLLLLHGESLAEHGGGHGMRDETLLDSALARPLHLEAYGTPDHAALAASYGVGIAKNHPFVDGNKRAAFLAIGLFLYLNGWKLHASQADATITMISVADGSLDEDGLAAWVRKNTVKKA